MSLVSIDNLESPSIENNFLMKSRNDLPQIPFIQVISAPRKSGKSYLIKNLLLNKEMMRDLFDYIIILNPSLDLNDDYDGIVNTDKTTVYKFSKVEDFKNIITETIKTQEEIIKHHKKERCPQVLLVLDDIIDSNLLNFRGIVDRLATRGRHANISVICSSQRLSAVSRTIRLNCDSLIFFSPSNYSEFEQILGEYIPRHNKKKVNTILDEAFNIPYLFISILNTEKIQKDKVRLGFGDKIFI